MYKTLPTLSLIFTFSLGFLALSPLGQASSPSTSEIKELYKNAILTSRMVSEIHHDGLDRRNLESKQLDNLLTHIKESGSINETLYKNVKSSLKQDIKHFETLNRLLKSYSIGVKGTTFQLKTNKMHLGAQGALKLMEGSFYDICSGKLPEGYSIDPPLVNIYLAKEHIYSSGRGIALKHLLLRTAMGLQKTPDLWKLKDVLDKQFKGSPFIHLTPLPTGIDLTDVQDCPYIVKGNEKSYLSVVHNGYTFGGQRFEETVEKFGPEDCSSFVSRYFGLHPQTSTCDQYIAYQILNKRFHFAPLGEKIVQTWNKKCTESYSNMKTTQTQLEKLKPMTIKNPSHVKPGLIHVERRFRTFPKAPLVIHRGDSGHTGVTLGVIGQGKEAALYTIGANRDIEKQNMDFSYGVQARPLFGDPLYQDSQKAGKYRVNPQVPLVMYFQERQN